MLGTSNTIHLCYTTLLANFCMETIFPGMESVVKLKKHWRIDYMSQVTSFPNLILD